MALQTMEESIKEQQRLRTEYYERKTQYGKDLRDPKKFTVIFLGSKYCGVFPQKEMFYAMAAERWRGYVLILVDKFSSMHIPPELQEGRKLFMITDTEINELEPADFHWSPAAYYTEQQRKINEEHGGYADSRIISTTNIADILNGAQDG